MQAIPLPSLERLNELFEYCPETGELIWRVSQGRVRAGELADCRHKLGYLAVCVDGCNYRVHRICFKMATGQEPEETDHRNGIPSDNRLTNLRASDKLGNSRNAKMQKNNTSGACGVYWRKETKKWRASVWVGGRGGRNENLGCFDDFEEAVAARKAAEIKYGFSPIHGLPADVRAAFC